MICLIAGNYLEAKQWARGQLLEDSEWFFPIDFHSLKHMNNFHVLVVGSAGMNVPNSYFDKLLLLAQERGRIGRHV